MFEYLTHTLDNGLRIVFVPTGSPSVTTALMIGVGSKNESSRIRGISHFLEHMAFKGTEKRPSALAITEELDKIGALYNASTGKEVTSYWIKSTADHLELMFDVISDIVFHSLLEEKEIKKEKGVIIEEINMYEDDPKRKVWDLSERVVFGNNPLGWEIIGSKKTVSQLKRKDFVDYQKTLYSPANMVLAIGGALKKGDWSRVLKLVEKWFGKVKLTPVKKERVGWQAGREKKLVKKKKTEQTHLVLELITFDLTDSRRWPMSVLSLILGGNMSSRLWRKIREQRGWAYYIHSFSDYYQEGGLLGVKAGLNNDKVAEAVKLIKQEMLGFAETVKEKEIKEAKSCLKGRFLLSLEPSGKAANLAARSWLLEDRLCTAEEILDKLAKVTLDDVRSLAEDFFKERNFYLAAIGPNKNLTI